MIRGFITSLSESDTDDISSFSHLHAKINLKQFIDSNSTFLLAQDCELLCLPEKETFTQAVKGFLDVCDQQRWVFQETPLII